MSQDRHDMVLEVQVLSQNRHDMTYVSPDPLIGKTRHMALEVQVLSQDRHDIWRQKSRSCHRTDDTTYDPRSPGPVIRQTGHMALEVQVLSQDRHDICHQKSRSCHRMYYDICRQKSRSCRRTDTTYGVRSTGPVIGQTRHMALEIQILSQDRHDI